MKTHARSLFDNTLSSLDLTARLSSQICERYEVDPRLASEMAWDLLELLDAVDGNRETLDKFFLH